MELAKQKCESQYITRAIRSLKNAKYISSDPLPMVSLLLAQAEASLGSKPKWEINLRDEWFSWPPGFFLSYSDLFPSVLLHEVTSCRIDHL